MAKGAVTSVAGLKLEGTPGVTAGLSASSVRAEADWDRTASVPFSVSSVGKGSLTRLSTFPFYQERKSPGTGSDREGAFPAWGTLLFLSLPWPLAGLMSAPAEAVRSPGSPRSCVFPTRRWERFPGPAPGAVGASDRPPSFNP